MDYPLESSFEEDIIIDEDDDDVMLICDTTTLHESITDIESDIDMPEVESAAAGDSSEIAAIVCGVPVMISDNEAEMKENINAVQPEKNVPVSPNKDLKVSTPERKLDDSHYIKEIKSPAVGAFYAVSLPQSVSVFEASSLVFETKIDALNALKKHPGARFKIFDSYEDAIHYSTIPLPSLSSQSFIEEKSSNFKSVTSQQMVALRKTIEKGDETSFLDTVWANPRYLINSAGDGPTVMQEGTRYNALHVAARFKQAGMVVVILNTIQDHQFMSLLYPLEDFEMIENRINRLVDLYLNMPDKSLSETPLHFACKFGADEVLSVLLSYRQCDVNKKNKYHLSPREMICDRASHLPPLKEKMSLMFEDLFYVPVLRDLANNIQEPVIGKPCCVNTFLSATSSALTFGKNSLIYCAFAGPMSQPAAYNFYTLFKNRNFSEKLPLTPEEKKQLVDICLSDSEKGLERVGRKLAKELNVGWIEFWPSLQFWGDLSQEGLEFLEKKLKSQIEAKRVSTSPCTMQEKCELLLKEIIDFIDDLVQKLPKLLENKDKMTFFLLFQSVLPHLFCLTKPSFSKDDELFLVHKEIGHLLYLKFVKSNKKGFEDLRFYLNYQFHSVDAILKPHRSEHWKMLVCILKNTCYYYCSDVGNLKPPKCDCCWNIQLDYSYSSCVFLELILNEIEYFSYPANFKKVHFFDNVPIPPTVPSKYNENVILTPFRNLSLEFSPSHCNAKQESSLPKTSSPYPVSAFSPKYESGDTDIYSPSCKSIEIIGDYNDSDMSDDKLDFHDSFADWLDDSPGRDESEELDNFFTPPQSPSHKEELFVNGINDFSDVDIDIFRAIVDGGAKVIKTEFPLVFEWKHLMESKLRSLLKPSDKLSCTPASSSACIRRAVMPIEKIRRTLF